MRIILSLALLIWLGLSATVWHKSDETIVLILITFLINENGAEARK